MVEKCLHGKILLSLLLFRYFLIFGIINQLTIKHSLCFIEIFFSIVFLSSYSLQYQINLVFHAELFVFFSEVFSISFWICALSFHRSLYFVFFLVSIFLCLDVLFELFDFSIVTEWPAFVFFVSELLVLTS